MIISDFTGFKKDFSFLASYNDNKSKEFINDYKLIKELYKNNVINFTITYNINNKYNPKQVIIKIIYLKDY
jgi:hypothetical protein